MTTESNKNDAARLAAVLRVLDPKRQWMIYEAGYAWVQEAGDGFTSGYRGEKFRPTSKSDLARVVAMLTPEQRAMFCDRIESLLDLQHGVGHLLLFSAITAPTSTILDALHRAVCPE